jgi:hypothetical protein
LGKYLTLSDVRLVIDPLIRMTGPASGASHELKREIISYISSEYGEMPKNVQSRLRERLDEWVSSLSSKGQNNWAGMIKNLTAVLDFDDDIPF